MAMGRGDRNGGGGDEDDGGSSGSGGSGGGCGGNGGYGGCGGCGGQQRQQRAHLAPDLPAQLCTHDAEQCGRTQSVRSCGICASCQSSWAHLRHQDVELEPQTGSRLDAYSLSRSIGSGHCRTVHAQASIVSI